MANQPITMRRRRMSVIMLSAGSTMLGPISSANSASFPARHEMHLPQHRVRSAKRQVPYPAEHPLSRHLQAVAAGRTEHVEFEESDGVVGGDVSRAQARERRPRATAEPSAYWSANSNVKKLLRFMGEPAKWPRAEGAKPASSPKRPRRRRRRRPEEPEEVQEVELLRNDGGVVRYWTVTGRTLVDGNFSSLEHSDANDAIVRPEDSSWDVQGNENATELVGSAGVTVSQNETLGVNATHNKTDAKETHDTTLSVNGTIDESLIANQTAYVPTSIDGQKFNLTDKEVSSALHDPPPAEEDPDSLYQPIRLRAIFTDDDTSGSKYLTDSQRTILMEEMINPALYAWSKALHVVPVDDNSGSGKSSLRIDQSQLFDNETCGPGLDSGLPSVRVPKEHFVNGLVDTDTVIYISVSFTDSLAQASTASEKPNFNFLKGNKRGPLFGGKGYEHNETTTSIKISSPEQTTSFPSSAPSDMPTMTPTEEVVVAETRPTCPGTYLASATYCSSDQFDRPVAGILALCIDNVHDFFYDRKRVQRNIITIMHEIGHVLGFNAQSLSHFRDGETGEPLTERDGNGDVPDVKVECTGISPRTKSEIPLPSKKLMRFRLVREDVRAAVVVTPTVKRVARNMFGCQSLIGAELESGEGQFFIDDVDDSLPLPVGACLGDHWERRVFRTDLLNPILDDVPYSLFISSLTLAFFADSGWYKVNTTRIAPSSLWGRNAGCDFVEKKCISSDGQVPASNIPFFCNKMISSKPGEPITDIHGCNLDSSSKAVCSLAMYDSSIPDQYSYFGKWRHNGQEIGGSDPTLDYCPVYEGFSNGRCDDANAKKIVGVRSSLEVFGEPNSRCMIGKVDRKRTSLCLPIACVIQDHSLMVKVDGYWKHCKYAGQIISMWWDPKDYVVCPDPSRLCPSFFCPNDCFLEGGVCDYGSGKCLCPLPSDTLGVNRTTSYFSPQYTPPQLVPCTDSPSRRPSDYVFQTVERKDLELPDYYVDNTTLLLDDPKDFDDKMSRMFSQLSTGEVFGLVASFMVFIIFSCLMWAQLVRCYKDRILSSSLSKARSSVNSLTGMIRDSSRLLLGDGNEMSMPPTHRRPSPPSNPQKDKMVATLLVQLRTEGTAIAEQERRERLQLGGMVDNSDCEKHVSASSNVQTATNLSAPSNEEVLVNRSELPPLPEGRVLAVIGARIVEDQIDFGDSDDRSTVTTDSQVTSQTFTTANSHAPGHVSPLYQEEDRRNMVQRTLRLRHVDRISLPKGREPNV